VQTTKAISDALIVVDNTFATPYLQKPLTMGADIVVHSITKYLSGHSDVVMGAVVTSHPHLAEKLKFIQKSTGAVPSPMDCFLVLRGIKTLHVRMRQHCENAHYLAMNLANHPRIQKLFYPFYDGHPNLHVAMSQMKMGGGMLSFTLNGTYTDVIKFLKGLRIIHLAESLGGVESLICHPATMTHAYLSPEERQRKGITDTLLRLSTGIEDKDDLLEDILNALSKLD